MRRMREIMIAALGALAVSGFNASSGHAAERGRVESGATQVVAKLNKREITISDLRGEMARLGLAPGDPASEPTALRSIIRRALLADAAREAGLHRQPEALRQMARAQEQALADIYLASASQPPEPTRAEIEDFIIANPELFNERRIYTFSVLTMPAAVFDEKRMTPFFDNTEDFSALADALDRAGVDFEITPAVQPSDAFPEPIRKQLGEYGVKDNIAIRGEKRAQIMKIVAVKKAPLSREAAPALARRALMATDAQAKAEKLITKLTENASLAYYRKSAAPTGKD